MNILRCGQSKLRRRPQAQYRRSDFCLARDVLIGFAISGEGHGTQCGQDMFPSLCPWARLERQARGKTHSRPSIAAQNHLKGAAAQSLTQFS